MSKTAPLLMFLASLALQACGGCPPCRDVQVQAEPGAFPVLGPISGELARQLVPWLGSAPPNPVLVIDSPGGELPPSAAIALAVRLRGDVRCVVAGQAKSGAFGILQQCRLRQLVPGAKLATHEVAVFWSGRMDRHDAANVRDQLEAASRFWNTLVAWRLKVTPEEYAERVRGKDWELDAGEAVKVGAADEVLGGSHTPAP